MFFFQWHPPSAKYGATVTFGKPALPAEDVACFPLQYHTEVLFVIFLHLLNQFTLFCFFFSFPVRHIPGDQIHLEEGRDTEGVDAAYSDHTVQGDRCLFL